MEKKIAIRIMQFLDKVSTTGHKERMEMNACVDALVQLANQPDTPTGNLDGGRAKPPKKQLPPRKPAANKAATRRGKVS